MREPKCSRARLRTCNACDVAFVAGTLALTVGLSMVAAGLGFDRAAEVQPGPFGSGARLGSDHGGFLHPGSAVLGPPVILSLREPPRKDGHQQVPTVHENRLERATPIPLGERRFWLLGSGFQAHCRCSISIPSITPPVAASGDAPAAVPAPDHRVATPIQ